MINETGDLIGTAWTGKSMLRGVWALRWLSGICSGGNMSIYRGGYLVHGSGVIGLYSGTLRRSGGWMNWKAHPLGVFTWHVPDGRGSET